MTVEVFTTQTLEPTSELARRWASGGLLERGGTIGSIIGGLVKASDLSIVAAVSGLKVEVAAGEVYVPGSSSATQSGYYVRNSATATLTFGAADGTNPRIETIIVRVKDKTYAGTEDLAEVTFVAGTATAGATLANLNGKGAVPASSYVLGYVLVPAKATSLTNTEVKDISTVALPGLQRYEEGTAAARPAVGVKGRIYYATDTKHYWIDNGAAWEALFNLASTAAYTEAMTARAANTNFEPSATRPTFVTATTFSANAASMVRALFQVGGVEICSAQIEGSGSEKQRTVVSFLVPPALKWKWEAAVGSPEVFSSYLIL